MAYILAINPGSTSTKISLFDGAKVSHLLKVQSPSSDDMAAKDAVKNVSRISLSVGIAAMSRAMKTDTAAANMILFFVFINITVRV